MEGPFVPFSEIDAKESKADFYSKSKPKKNSPKLANAIRSTAS